MLIILLPSSSLSAPLDHGRWSLLGLTHTVCQSNPPPSLESFIVVFFLFPVFFDSLFQFTPASLSTLTLPLRPPWSLRSPPSSLLSLSRSLCQCGTVLCVCVCVSVYVYSRASSAFSRSLHQHHHLLLKPPPTHGQKPSRPSSEPRVHTHILFSRRHTTETHTHAHT